MRRRAIVNWGCKKLAEGGCREPAGVVKDHGEGLVIDGETFVGPAGTPSPALGKIVGYGWVRGEAGPVKGVGL